KDMSLDSFLNYIHPEDREIVQSNYFRSSIDENLKNYYSVRIKRKDLKEIIVEINSVKLLRNEKYEIIFFIKDITNRKLAEEEIKNALEKEKELSELRSRFISMTSHEFRTPLTSINTSVEILEKFSEQLTQEQKRNNLIRIHDNVQKMKRLLNDVLIIGKSDAGMYKLKLEPVDINQFCNQLIDEFHTYVMFKTKHKFKFETENLNNRVLLDKDLIKQVIENFFSNAVKYSSPGSTVYFKMNFSTRFIIFSVKDEGVGIPEEDINNLFEPFFRASNTGNVSGSGLGLAIVKRAVELHNGKIGVKSEIGKGTKFTVTIPLIKVV
ncbi:MAG: PAS domain-containing sensor histidine kinase, partial [Ignavibacteriae bacterium]|nr:PAS domain-containing sensor histidine kinase [Ignavibacteriota bacterium]